MKVSCVLRRSVGDRQPDAEGSTSSLSALNFDAAAVRLNDGLGLKHADAKAFLLRRFEWLEQGSLHEVRSHAAAVVTDAQ